MTTYSLHDFKDIKSKFYSKIIKKLEPDYYYDIFDLCISDYLKFNNRICYPIDNTNLELDGIEFQEIFHRGDKKKIKKIFRKLLNQLIIGDKKEFKHQLEDIFKQIQDPNIILFSSNLRDFIFSSNDFSKFRISIAGFGPSLFRIVFYYLPSEYERYISWQIIHSPNRFLISLKLNKSYINKYILNTFCISKILIITKIIKRLFVKNNYLKIFIEQETIFYKKNIYTKLRYFWNAELFRKNDICIKKLHKIRKNLLKHRTSPYSLITQLFTVKDYIPTAVLKKEQIFSLENNFYEKGKRFLKKNYNGLIFYLTKHIPCTNVYLFSSECYELVLPNYHINIKNTQQSDILNIILEADCQRPNRYFDYRDATLFSPIHKKNSIPMNMIHILNSKIITTPTTDALSIASTYNYLLNYNYEELLRTRNEFFTIDYTKNNKKQIQKIENIKKKINIIESFIELVKSDNRLGNTFFGFGNNEFENKYIMKDFDENNQEVEINYFIKYKEFITNKIGKIEELLSILKQLYDDRYKESSTKLNNQIQKTIKILTILSILVGCLQLDSTKLKNLKDGIISHYEFIKSKIILVYTKISMDEQEEKEEPLFIEELEDLDSLESTKSSE